MIKDIDMPNVLGQGFFQDGQGRQDTTTTNNDGRDDQMYSQAARNLRNRFDYPETPFAPVKKENPNTEPPTANCGGTCRQLTY